MVEIEPEVELDSVAPATHLTLPGEPNVQVPEPAQIEEALRHAAAEHAGRRTDFPKQSRS